MNTTAYLNHFVPTDLDLWLVYAQTTALTSLIFTVNLESSKIKQQHLSIVSTIAAAYSLLPLVFYSWTLLYMTAALICLPACYKQLSPFCNFAVVFAACLCSDVLQDVLYAGFAICLLIQWISSMRKRRLGVMVWLTFEVCAVAYLSFLGWVALRLTRLVYDGLGKHKSICVVYFATVILLLAVYEDCHRLETLFDVEVV